MHGPSPRPQPTGGPAGARSVKVTAPERGLTLQEWVARKSGASNRQVKRWLDQKRIFINGRRVWMARHVLAAGDVVEYPAVREPGRKPGPLAIPILFEDDWYLVADKPAGWVTNQHPDSVETRLKKTGQAVQAVHRLDRDTSGCLLFAKSTEAFERMIPLFQEREVEKVYRAIVLGKVPQSLRQMNKALDQQEALTHLRVVRSTDEASYVECRLETGRTHQIRRHLQLYGFGLAGDKQYPRRGGEAEPAWARQCTRHMLHACRLSFRHPFTQAVLSTESPLPEEMTGLAVALGLLPRRRNRARPDGGR